MTVALLVAGVVVVLLLAADIVAERKTRELERRLANLEGRELARAALGASVPEGVRESLLRQERLRDRLRGVADGRDG